MQFVCGLVWGAGYYVDLVCSRARSTSTTIVGIPTAMGLNSQSTQALQVAWLNSWLEAWELTESHAESPESAAGPRRIPSATVRDQLRHRCMERCMTALPGNGRVRDVSTEIAIGKLPMEESVETSPKARRTWWPESALTTPGSCWILAYKLVLSIVITHTNLHTVT